MEKLQASAKVNFRSVMFQKKKKGKGTFCLDIVHVTCSTVLAGNLNIELWTVQDKLVNCEVRGKSRQWHSQPLLGSCRVCIRLQEVFTAQRTTIMTWENKINVLVGWLRFLRLQLLSLRSARVEKAFLWVPWHLLSLESFNLFQGWFKQVVTFF